MKAPTPIELMAYADGELDEPRASEVERYLVEHPEQAHVVERTRALSRGVSEALHERDVDLADDIMAAIDRQAAAGRNAALPPVRASARPPATAAARGGTVIVLSLFAAAAAVMLWWHSSSPSRAPVTVASVTPQQAAPPTSTDEGTSVTAVDFGSNHGAIFFVRGDNESSTPVVWIGEDPAP